jgi:hypothetical protein
MADALDAPLAVVNEVEAFLGHAVAVIGDAFTPTGKIGELET